MGTPRRYRRSFHNIDFDIQKPLGAFTEFEDVRQIRKGNRKRHFRFPFMILTNRPELRVERDGLRVRHWCQLLIRFPISSNGLHAQVAP